VFPLFRATFFKTFVTNGRIVASQLSQKFCYTASGLARYDTINITDSGAGASVTFNDSSGNTYSDSFNITLDDGSGTVSVNNAVSRPVASCL
jgi:hypothetical protein